MSLTFRDKIADSVARVATTARRRRHNFQKKSHHHRKQKIARVAAALYLLLFFPKASQRAESQILESDWLIARS